MLIRLDGCCRFHRRCVLHHAGPGGRHCRLFRGHRTATDREPDRCHGTGPDLAEGTSGVSDPPTRSLAALPIDAQTIVRGHAVLGVDQFDTASAAAVTAAVNEAITALITHGWIVATDDRWTFTPAARNAMADFTPATDPTFTHHVLAAQAKRHHTMLRGPTDPAHDHFFARREEIAALLTAAHRHRRHDLVIDLALALWPVAKRIPDPAWYTTLARHGEDAAIAARRPADLATLLHHAAGAFTAIKDYPTAEARWTRARTVWRRLGADDQVRHVHAHLGRLYRDWGRPHRAMDMYLELTMAYHAVHDLPNAADAEVQLGLTMLDAQRPDDAIHHLSQADETLRSIQATHADQAVRHASVLETLGRVLHQHGATRAAKDTYSRALAMLIDVDDEAADRVRALLAAATRPAT